MNPKIIFGLIAVIVTAFWPGSCLQTSAQTTSATNDVDYYTCTMHPSVHSKTPGKCPICGMDLVPVYKKSATTNTPPVETEGTNQVSDDDDNQPGEFTVPIDRQQQ